MVLKGTGAAPITDLAGNPLSGAFDGQHRRDRERDLHQRLRLRHLLGFSRPNAQSHLIYVGTAADGGTGTGTLGTRENPFPTIGAAMTAAVIGDDVLVLPGTYEEDVTMKPGVRLLSADPWQQHRYLRPARQPATRR